MTPVRMVLERPVAVVIGFASVVVLGCASLVVIPVDLLPEVKVPKFAVRCLAPGMPAEVLERTVTIPVESALQGLEGVRRVSAVTRDGVAVITPEFSWSSDPGSVLLDLRDRLDQTATVLPAGVHRPTVLSVDPLEEPVLRIAVSPLAEGGGPLADVDQLGGASEFIVRVFRRRLELVHGVARVSLTGAREHEILIEADPERMSAAGLIPGDLLRTVGSNYVYEPAGESVRSEQRRPAVLATDVDGPPALRRLGIPVRPGAPAIRLGDLANVTWGVKEPPGRVRVSGREVVELKVFKESGANAISTARNVRQEVDLLRDEYPGFVFEVVFDESSYIRRTANEVVEAGVLGGILSFGLLLLVLRNWRDPLVAGISYPISVAATIAVLHLLGIHVNLLSLAGLALGIGMLGDNAVIVIENIRTCRERGLSLRASVLEGAAGITLPAAVSTLTNVAVFLPVLMLDGIGRQLFGEMAISMTASLVVSLLVSTMLVPILIDRFGGGGGGIVARRGAGPPWLPRFFLWSIRRRRRVLAASGVAMVASVAYAAFLTTGSSPALDETALEVTLEFPAGTGSEVMHTILRPLEYRLLRIDGVESVRSETGTPEELDIWEAHTSSTCRASVHLRLAPGASPQAVTGQLRRTAGFLEQQIAGLRTTVGSRSTSFDRLLNIGDRRIAIRITGITGEMWPELSGGILDAVRAVQGIGDLLWPGRSPVNDFVIRPDPLAAGAQGVPMDQVEAALQSLRGTDNRTLLPLENGAVQVRCVFAGTQGDRGAAAVLEEKVDAGGRLVPLRALVTSGWEERPSELYREDGRRVFLVTANAAGRPEAEVIADLRVALSRLSLPGGAAAAVGMSSREAADSTGSLWVALLLSFVLMYILFAAEYGSALLPLVVLASSPLAFVGAVAAMAVAGEPMGVLSLAGLIITVGAVDNDAVIAVDLIARYARSGTPWSTSIVRGMMMRLRPILITSLTTVLGVVPLLFQSGSGSVLVRSMAIPLAGGLVASTAATLLVIPALLAVVGSRRMVAGATGGRNVR